MKKLLAMAAVVALFATQAMALEHPFSKAKLYGEGSFYGSTYENVAENIGGTGLYATMGLSFNIYENILASFALGYTNVWGDGYSTEGRPISDSNSGRGLLEMLKIVEANIAFSKVLDVDGLSLKIGRQYYGDEDSTVMYFGIRRDNPMMMMNGSVNSFGSISSLDAAVAHYEKGNVKANAVYGIFENGNLNGNNTLMGADFKYLNIADMIDVQAYMYDIENGATRHYSILGIKPTFKMSGLKASVEIAKNFGGNEIFSNDEDNTNFVKADVSYNIEKAGLTPRVMYGVFGGDSKSFDAAFGNFTPGLIAGQLLFDYTDNQIINVGADFVKNKFTFSFDFFNFGSRDGDDNENFAKFGNEIDLAVKYAYTEKVNFRLGIGHLFGDEDNNDFDSSTVQAGVTYKF